MLIGEQLWTGKVRAGAPFSLDPTADAQLMTTVDDCLRIR
jgi:hypothetical protein